ncbi:MAG: 30S ribosomal protein S5 [Candidatus Njordarchaeales archaeon]
MVKIREIPDPVTPREELETLWKPTTKIGKMVKEGRIQSIDEIFAITKRIPEWQIVDWLVPDLRAEVLDVNIVRRTTDSGRRNSFRVLVVVGNMDGYIGVGMGKHPEQREAIIKALKRAKKNLAPILRGCGSWECRCGQPHSVPFKVEGKCGSVRIVLYPAPRGLGLVAGDIAKRVLSLAGVRDVWTKTFGNTRTHINFAKAVYDALVNTYLLL